MTFKVYVDGQEGTTGLQIHDFLSRRDDIEVLRIESSKRKDDTERQRLLNQADVAFLCLPDAASRQAASLVDNPDTCLIDASTAFRVDENWVYGLPELQPGQRQAIRDSKRIANVGCHASAFILAVRPLVEAGLLAADYPVSAFSQTGYSGGGKRMIAEYDAEITPALSAPRSYALELEHKHLPEMQAYSGLQQAPVFVPTVGPFLKGLAVWVPLHLSLTDVDEVYRVYQSRYRGEPFVRVHSPSSEQWPEDGFFDVQGSNDSNYLDLFVFGNAERQCVVARLDNLGKGAAGAAIQNMNVHLGLEETLGLAKR